MLNDITFTPMRRCPGIKISCIFAIFFLLSVSQTYGQSEPRFRSIAFFTGRNDQAHISFVKEAHEWLKAQAKANNFIYDTTSDWHKLDSSISNRYQLLIFLDTRPPEPQQRKAFESYMNNGGAWIGFHFAAFALTPSDFPQNWDWYHNYFLGAGQYVGNTWRPTAAFLKVENKTSPITKNIPALFKSAPNEWYRWEKDLRTNPDIDVLLSIDSSSFPLGTGPKPHEIWHKGDFPVAWTNRKFRMVYFNMGHNDIDYENKTNQTLSFTFQNAVQNQLVLNAILYLGETNRKKQLRK